MNGNGNNDMEMNKGKLINILQMTKEAVEDVFGPISAGNDEAGRHLTNTYIVNIIICILQNLIPNEANLNITEESIEG